MQEVVANTIIKELKKNSETILGLKVYFNGLVSKIDDLEKVLAENTVEMINIRARVQNLEEVLRNLKDEITVNNIEKERLLNTLFIKILNLTERVEALEK